MASELKDPIASYVAHYRLLLAPLIFCGVMLAGCSSAVGFSRVLAAPPDDMPPSDAGSQRYRVLFSFGSNAYGLDGAGPVAPLLNVNGAFYGTTQYGGAYHGGGTVFEMSMSGINERVLYSFRGNGPYTGGPVAGLTLVKGMLYGTTTTDGIYGGGTTFRISTTGTNYRVLHNFGRGSDGAQPRAALIAVNGRLYGTTYQGGSGCSSSGGCGTVFRMSLNGQERVTHSFSGRPDGEYPAAALVDVNGTLYGTTESGGANGGGAVFSINTEGSERVVYSFGNRPDGNTPVANLIFANGLLYGTTLQGGSASIDGGTVFSVTTAGTNERVLHSFGSGIDGSKPQAGLTAMKGYLYGTTAAGGAAKYGIIFRISMKGKERVMHSFGQGYQNDGLNPQADLVDVKGTLYGTTPVGGISLPSCEETGTCDYGTVFALTP
jgi:uncharacterized repeat protein (TIGR03803 family)